MKTGLVRTGTGEDEGFGRLEMFGGSVAAAGEKPSEGLSDGGGGAEATLPDELLQAVSAPPAPKTAAPAAVSLISRRRDSPL
ncbi:hypothetical protein GCM10010430_07300 [Kitasatospora cystarginea]|uniref:Uncharacterized protein n=1 Tax=Kitasatospora cystarginea TaxID=58350 RepID=A0ABN3DFI5_9ACTN